MARPPARLTCSGMGRLGRAIVAAVFSITPSAAAVARTVDHSNVASGATAGKSPKGESLWHVLQPFRTAATMFGTSTEWTGSWWLDAASASASASRAWPGVGATAFLGVAQMQDPLVVTAPPDAADDTTRALRGMRTLIGIITVLVSSVFALVVAFFAYQYRLHKVQPKTAKYNTLEDFTDYQTGLFDCWDDLHLCCFAFNCPWITWADNISSVSIEEQQPRKAPILNYWVALCTILLLYILGNLGGGLVWIIMACVLAFFRQKFRKAFAMASNTGACMQDCLLYLCCGVCILAQDARHLEEARIQDHPAIVKF